MTSNIRRKEAQEKWKVQGFQQCILLGFNLGFDHLYGHKFPLDQYASLAILFAPVRKIQRPGRSGEEMSK